ncbi:hypothetical protein PA598K_03974 [Paenibacillus sp. 598K]|uniref:helix-turn-helix domain-containing protein n=1 Tax=Paenibacillus sp. 598K TaxID=1117987 RepID=UPI000FFAE73A|nr:helix-turn-helix domain-containing protein [Paenibacillus sp. 598K]GBF75557.1 hypothetical protein PA598K_03974 [Paenibacillus sp. 598K]
MQGPDPGWLAYCTAIEDLAEALGEQDHIHLDRPALVLITDGQTTLSINGHEAHVVFGHLVAVAKGSVIALSPALPLDFSGYLLSFDTYDTTIGTIYEWDVNSSTGYEVHKVSETIVADTRVALADAAEELHLTMRQFILYSLLKELKPQRPADEDTLEHRLARTVHYMQQKYTQRITREQLAAIAGYSPSYYSRQFHALYHQTPIEYLIRTRILRAQELLLTTDDASNQIAKKAGFDDAQYFNRQFKRMVGKPPKQYKASIASYRICFLSSAHAEIAIALGVIPDSVAVTRSLTPGYLLALLQQHSVTLLDMPQYVLRQDRIVEQQPELLIGDVVTEEAKRDLRTAAPVLTRLPRDIYSLIRYFGGLFDRERQARELIDELTAQADTLRRNIHRHIEEGSTVLYLRVEESGYRYIGEASIESAILLYEELGLSMPALFRSNERSFNPCSLQQVAEADPTYLFIEKRQMDYYNADLSFSNLQQSKQWASLDAVKNKRVCYVDTGLWINHCSAYGKREIMRQIEQFMLGRV